MEKDCTRALLRASGEKAGIACDARFFSAVELSSLLLYQLLLRHEWFPLVYHSRCKRRKFIFLFFREASAEEPSRGLQVFVQQLLSQAEMFLVVRRAFVGCRSPVEEAARLPSRAIPSSPSLGAVGTAARPPRRPPPQPPRLLRSSTTMAAVRSGSMLSGLLRRGAQSSQVRAARPSYPH